MARYWAEIKDNKVLRVVVCESLEWLEKNLGGTWVETFQDRESEGINYAGIGSEYYVDKKNFTPIKAYNSWALNETTMKYDPPIAKPTDGAAYYWKESEQKWVKMADTTL